VLLLCLFFNSTAQENIERKNKLKFSNKIIHSFGLQYNNTFHSKGKFEYRDDDVYRLADHPCISYGREYIVKYNLTFPSGWGITTEFLAGNWSPMTYAINSETGEKKYKHFLWFDPLSPIFNYTYFGGQLKASYMYRLHKRITLQPEIGIKLLKYVRGNEWGHLQQSFIVDEYGSPIIVEQWEWFNVSDLYYPKRFMPELTGAINFLFHTKRDLRHNFILGINGTLSFLDRYAGWQQLTASGEKDVFMKWGSSFFALNMGYEFTGFKKPFYKTKKYKKEIQQFEFLDFSKAVHSFGVYFTSGFSFNVPMKETQGQFRPISGSCFVPEFNLKYSLSVKNGFGFTVEIPVGLFQRYAFYSLLSLIPQDTVWAYGKAIGSGEPITLSKKMPYIGLTLKFSYLTHIHRNMLIQPEVGIKFMPFLFPAWYWGMEDSDDYDFRYINEQGEPTDIIWLKHQPSLPQKYYAVPDITMAINFMVRGKKSQNNFIFGINANIGLVDRLSFRYYTTEAIPSDLKSSGRYGWKSTFIGFHIGYQFMTGKKCLSNKFPHSEIE